MDLSPGFILHNRYKIIRLLGQGGMGAVYLADDQSLANEVAVKVNRSTSPKAAAQFIAEARLLSTLRHSNLPRVFDYFQEEGTGQFLVMDYIAGQDLKSLLENHQVPALDQVLAWAAQLGAALSYLHRQNPPVFHRDVKPANLKLTTQNEIILVDFGIAKAAASSSDTATGASLLSPGYAPPEQYGVGHTGAYSDQYAMGATFYQLLTEQLPADAFQRLMGKATLAPVQSLNPSVPLHVDQALQRAMALRVEDRFASVDDFVYALSHPSANASYGPTTPAAGVYPPTLASGISPASQPVYPAQPAYPPTLAQPGYPPAQQQPYAPAQPTYPPAQPGYPPVQQPAYPPAQGYPPSQPPYPPAQPTFPPSQPPYPPAQAARRFPWLWVGIIGLVLIFACGGLVALVTSMAETAATPTPPPTAIHTALPATPTVKAAASATAVANTATVKALTSTVPAASATPVGSATRTTAAGTPPPGGGALLQNPAGFLVKYLTFFQNRTYGFSDLDWIVKLSTGAKVTTSKGVLSVLGGVEATGTDTTLGNDIRIFLGGGSYGIGLKDFTLFVQRSANGSSYLRMSCLDQPKGASVMLTCEWYQMLAGKETRLENTASDLCIGTCDIEVELDSSTYRVFANKQLKTTFKNAQLTDGAIGLRINNPTQTPFTLDTISVYKIPKTSSLGSYVLLDDLGDVWPDGHSDNEFATIDRTLAADAYHWVVAAKQGVVTRASPTPDFVLPDRFMLFVDVQQLSGPTSACYGMFFREQDNDNGDYYFYCATDDGTISVSVRQNGEWVTLVDALATTEILAGELNTLAVRGDGNQYSFYVNDTVVTKITDDRLKGGTMGLAGEVSKAGQQVEWEYTQVQVNLLP